MSSTFRYEQFKRYFGPLTVEEALAEAIRSEEEAKAYPPQDPGRAMYLRDSQAALEYAEPIETRKEA